MHALPNHANLQLIALYSNTKKKTIFDLESAIIGCRNYEMYYQATLLHDRN